MKEKADPRHQSRRVAMQTLFEWSFLSRDPDKILQENLERSASSAKGGYGGESAFGGLDKELAQTLVQGVVNKREGIDKIIVKSAPEWPIAQISKVDLTILRIAVFEIIFAETVPAKVAIDEAVELGKEFGAEKSSKFVNGVLGTVVEELGNV